MNNDIRSALHFLDALDSGECSVADFQQHLEHILNAIPSLEVNEEKRVREFVNHAEIIFYTIPQAEQFVAMHKLSEEIREFLNTLHGEGGAHGVF